MKTFRHLKSAGFTLLELSIVLIVIGIMVSGALIAATSQIEAAKVKQTNEKLDKIERALQAYFEKNGYLPCPGPGNAATPTLAGTAATLTHTAGPSNDTCASDAVGVFLDNSTYGGVIPTRTLDLKDNTMLDGWGNRIAYFVSASCVDYDDWDHDPVGGTNTNECLSPEIEVSDTNGTLRSDLVVYALVSYGKNKLGGWNSNGSANPLPTLPKETENASYTGSSNIKLDGQLLDFDGAGANYFDDIVRWKTGTQIQYEKDN